MQDDLRGTTLDEKWRIFILSHVPLWLLIFLWLQLIEKSKQAGERQLLEKREKVIAELEKLRQRVDEFNDYGELDMMTQYVQDVRAVQKRLSDVQDQIGFINKVGVFLVTIHFEWKNICLFILRNQCVYLMQTQWLKKMFEKYKSLNAMILKNLQIQSIDKKDFQQYCQFCSNL